MQRDISSLLSQLHFEVQGRQVMQKHILIPHFPTGTFKALTYVQWWWLKIKACKGIIHSPFSHLCLQSSHFTHKIIAVLATELSSNDVESLPE